MTNQEAIKVLNDTCYDCVDIRDINECTCTQDCDFRKAVVVSIKALEKQIPKKPSQLLKHKDSFDWECPKCHMTYGCCNVNVNYCYECGQAIKLE